VIDSAPADTIMTGGEDAMMDTLEVSAAYAAGETAQALHANRIERLARASVSWNLTDRQLEVLALVCQGRTNKVVADRLGCCEKTIEAHMVGILRRSRSENRCHLVARFWSEL